MSFRKDLLLFPDIQLAPEIFNHVMSRRLVYDIRVRSSHLILLLFGQGYNKEGLMLLPSNVHRTPYIQWLWRIYIINLALTGRDIQYINYLDWLCFYFTEVNGIKTCLVRHQVPIHERTKLCILYVSLK